MKVAILTDSTASIPLDIRHKWDIHMIPLNVIFGDESYREEVDLDIDDFYSMVKEAKKLPKTSQPSIGLIEEKYQELAKDHDAVVSILLSSRISGTYQAVLAAGNMVEEIDVHCFDSEISAKVQGLYVLEAAEMAANGATADQIIARLTEMKQTMRAYFMVDDLSHLHRGGRLNGAQALVGSMLQVKPLLHFVEGKIVPFEKIRTRKRAVNRIVGLFEEDADTGKPIRGVIIHGNRQQDADDLKNEIEQRFVNAEISTSYISPVIGTHLGEGALGFGWYIK